MNQDSVKMLCLINNKHGLHARSAAAIVELVAQFESDVTLSTISAKAEACDMIRLLLLEATQGVQVEIIATGKDAQQAAKAVAALIDAGFNE